MIPKDLFIYAVKKNIFIEYKTNKMHNKESRKRCGFLNE
jgi:hypothetical protein